LGKALVITPKLMAEKYRMAFRSRISKSEGRITQVISDPKYLLPDPIGTLKAAEFLIKRVHCSTIYK
jgi:thiazole synthase ThiGH ThiG subunit